MISIKSVANAVSGKTARACDSCIKKRARWYCAADDAFLCQVCDSSVHSANPLARRHERVRLKTASFKLLSRSEHSSPPWHKGFTKKTRTLRSPKGWKWKANPIPFVPEVGADEISYEENDEEQLLYRVPIFDPFVAELCGGAKSNEADAGNGIADEKSESVDVVDKSTNNKAIVYCGTEDGENKLRGFFPSDLDLADFAADVESMLGKGFEDQSFSMEDLGLVESDDVKMPAVKVENEESSRESDRMVLDADGRDTFELNFDYDSPASCGAEDDVLVKEEDEKVDSHCGGEGEEEENDGGNSSRRKLLLSLDYEGVIGAWASRGSPWTTADRPEIDPDECNLPDFWVVGGKGMSLAYGDFAGMGMAPTIGDGGREARVSRYREKRRTRLFSKKIRYEVRKLNAEKRPRMKGRFVKRVSPFATPPPNSFTLP